MKYKNPVISGFFPDPSICRVDDVYYLVCSSFQFFPGVPLFESRDLVNWTMIGNVLTRKNQLPLAGANSSSGIFAPTIRYHEGRFYMVTTNVTKGGNFYVYTDDIYGEWSDPVFVEQNGIDPSLYFEDGRAYFMSNGTADDGEEGIIQCEIDIATGRKLSKSICLWKGTGGRYLESPHLYHINGYYYLMASEGGTEYGHMVVYARAKQMNGPYENYRYNPVLTNRNVGGYVIQGCGHGDLVEDTEGNYWMVHLGFRQIGLWVMHHITGREVYLVPVYFDEQGWFTAGEQGTTREYMEAGVFEVQQERWEKYDLSNLLPGREWCFLRNPNMENYQFSADEIRLRGNELTLQATDGSPTFLALRQKEMNQYISCCVSAETGEAGITCYMTERQHYDLAIRKTANGCEIFRRLVIGDACQEDHVIALPVDCEVKLMIKATNYHYYFSANAAGRDYDLGSAETKYLSTEIAGNFTGVVMALYAQHSATDFKAEAEKAEAEKAAEVNMMSADAQRGWAVFKRVFCVNEETVSQPVH